MKKELKGIFPAVVSPYDSKGNLNCEQYARIIEYLYEKGTHGLYICGATGDAYLMRIDERKRAAEIAIESGRKYGGISVVHIGANSTRDAMELAEHATKAGADAIAAMPVTNTNVLQLKRYYEDINSVSGLPILVYYIPSLTHRDISIDEMKSLLDIENVVGFKFSDYNLLYMKRVMLYRHDAIVFNGNDEILVYSLLNGAVGGIGMTYNVFPELFVAIYDYVKRGNVDAALMLQDAFIRYLDTAVKYGIRQSVEFGIQERIGFSKCFRPPYAVEKLGPEAISELRKITAYVDDQVDSVK